MLINLLLQPNPGESTCVMCDADLPTLVQCQECGNCVECCLCDLEEIDWEEGEE
jgi:hypothetical protein